MDQVSHFKPLIYFKLSIYIYFSKLIVTLSFTDINSHAELIFWSFLLLFISTASLLIL